MLCSSCTRPACQAAHACRAVLLVRNARAGVRRFLHCSCVAYQGPFQCRAGAEAMVLELLLHPTSEALRRAARQLLARIADGSGCVQKEPSRNTASVEKDAMPSGATWEPRCEGLISHGVSDSIDSAHRRHT